MPSIEFDTNELKVLTKDLDRARAVAMVDAVKVVTKAAVNVKADARQRVSGLAHAPAYPYSIGFDAVRNTSLFATTVVGPDKGKRQGALGNILEYGTVKNAPVPHLGPAAETEEPRFLKAMNDLAEKAFGL